MCNTTNKSRSFLICCVLVLSTLIAYEQVRKNSFVDYDDPAYITANPHIRGGVSFKNISRAFTSPELGFWHPLTILSHTLDCQLFGLNPKWHHIVNLLFHTANTLLLFWVLKKMAGAVWQSAFVAAAFALHPLHVESVAWAAQRKDVLSAFFWLLAMGAYVRYVKGGGANPEPERYRAKWYAGTFLLFVMGLMAKPMLVTLPFVMLLLDYWPLNRLKTQDSRLQTNGLSISDNIRNVVYEKVPFFALSGIFCVITFYTEKGQGALALGLPSNIRIANAIVSYFTYIEKMIWPARLAVFYPYPRNMFPLRQVGAEALLLVLISAWAIYLSRQRKYLIVGWLWYLGTLVPVIGAIQLGSFAMADRYTYIPSVGIFIIAAWGAAEITSRWRYRKIFLDSSLFIGG